MTPVWLHFQSSDYLSDYLKLLLLVQEILLCINGPFDTLIVHLY